MKVFASVLYTLLAVTAAQTATYGNPRGYNVIPTTDAQLNTIHGAAKEPTESFLIEQIRKMTQYLNEMVNGVIGDLLQYISNYSDTVTALSDQIRDEGTTAIKNLTTQAQDFIIKIAQQAAEAGVNSSTCTAGKTESITNLGSNLTAQLNSCISEQVSDLLQMLGNYQKRTENMVNDIQAMPVRLANCLIFPNPTTCLNGVLKASTELFNGLPEQLLHMTSTVQEQAKTVQKSLPTCVKGVMNNGTTAMEGFMEEVSKCVQELEPEGSQ